MGESEQHTETITMLVSKLSKTTWLCSMQLPTSHDETSILIGLGATRAEAIWDCLRQAERDMVHVIAAGDGDGGA